MNEHDKNMVPLLPEDSTPQDFGFPETPNAAQIRAWTNQQLWLEAFTRTGSVGAACAEVGVSVSTAEHWDTVDSYGFKKRKAMAGQLFLGKVEAEIKRRAIDGIDHPVIHQGKITGTYKQYSDNLLMFRAKRLDPEYRDTPRQVPAQLQITQININLSGKVTPPPWMVDSTSRELPEDTDGRTLPRDENGDTPS